MFKTKLLYLVLLAVMLLPLSLFATPKLMFAATIIRHGNRTPYYILKKDAYDWKLGPGQLLPIGMHKEHLLGVKLRNLLIKKEHLIPENYNGKLMYVWSGTGDRILMSAESLLSGLYPLGTGPKLTNGKPALPSGFQPIPIHTEPTSSNSLINENNVKSKEFNELLNKFSYTQQSWIDINKKYEKDFPRWSKIFGQKITNLADMLPIGDNMHVRMLYDIPLPKGISKKEAQNLSWLNLWAETQQYKPKIVGKFMAGPFLKNLAKYMKNSINGKIKIKYVLYSAHDSNLIGVMSAFGKPLDATTYPPYASNINFLVYEDNGEYSVKITYLDEVWNISNSKDGVCSLKEFFKIVNSI